MLHGVLLWKELLLITSLIREDLQWFSYDDRHLSDEYWTGMNNDMRFGYFCNQCYKFEFDYIIEQFIVVYDPCDFSSNNVQI
jgi:hypothetical protein